MKLGELFEENGATSGAESQLFVESASEEGTKLLAVAKSYSRTEGGRTRVVLVPAKPRASRARTSQQISHGVIDRAQERAGSEETFAITNRKEVTNGDTYSGGEALGGERG